MPECRRAGSHAASGRRAGILWLAIGLLLLGIGLVWIFFPRDPYAMPAADWRLFKSRFLSAEGRIVDTGNGGITHTEGQGYGMLLAVAYSDRKAFDRIWGWTNTHLRRKDGLFSWLWTPADGGKISDQNNASDGDFLLAWALLRASRKWDHYDYQKSAAQIVVALLDKTLVDTHLGLQMIPGLDGFITEQGVTLNPSYYIFPALPEMKKSFPSEKWEELAKGGVALVKTARFGKWRLSPDWALVTTDAVKIGRADTDPFFGYNAIRVPLHMAWADPKSPLLKPFADFWGGLPAGRPIPATVDLRNNQFGEYAALPGMMAVATLTTKCEKNEPLTVRDIPPLDKEEPYYSASLKLLTKLAIHEKLRPEKD